MEPWAIVPNRLFRNVAIAFCYFNAVGFHCGHDEPLKNTCR
jgi:hypothetical protein